MTRPNIQIPKEFAINGEKNDFTAEKIQSGFDNLNPDVLAGDNLNKLIDDTYKGINGVLDLYNGIVLHEITTTYDDKAVVGKFIDDNFKLYRSLQNENLGHDVTETEYWEELKLGGGAGLQMFDTVLKDHVLTFEESKGLALQGTYVYKTAVSGARYGYPDFYNKCVEEFGESVNTETVNGVTVKVHSNGHKFYDIADKTAIDEFFNSMGSAWFYGVDTANERIFLPRNNNFVQLATDTSQVGESVEAGLPNITGSADSGVSKAEYTIFSGAFKASGNAKPNISGNSPSQYYGLGFDASLSNPIYGKSNTVQPPAVKKILYMVVGNTEVTSSITNVTEITTSENDTIPLFTAQYFDFTPNNPSWLKAGTQQNSGGIYTTAYNTLVNCLTNNTYNLKVIDTTDMVVGVDYSEYWKVDQTNMTFTTPTSVSNKALTGAVVGNGITLGLTDGSKNVGVNVIRGNGFSGHTSAFGTSIGTTVSVEDIMPNNTYGITSDPTKSGIIAEESTAQLYFKVANAVQNLELMDAGKIGEQLATKTDMLQASGASMPSDKYIDLTLGASGTQYTAPANGWLYLRKRGNNGQYGTISNSTKGFGDERSTAVSNEVCSIMIYASKGDKLAVAYTLSGTTEKFKFIYAEGAKND